jgi:DNA-binding transcriptional ArsR family regulator
MEVPDTLFEPMAERLRLLADATRLRILSVLREGESSVVQIVGRTGASQPNVSRHLALLLRAGVVTRRPRGREVHYRVVDPFIDRICEAICGSLRAHVDRQAERLPGIPVQGEPVGAFAGATPSTSPRATRTSLRATRTAPGAPGTSPGAARTRRRT